MTGVFWAFEVWSTAVTTSRTDVQSNIQHCVSGFCGLRPQTLTEALPLNVGPPDSIFDPP